MRKQSLLSKIFLPALIITTSISSYAQQKITITSSKENNWCNSTCTLIDIPELNNNYEAIIFVTPKTDLIHNGVYPHPITVYYTGKQWSIMNLDNTAMQPGSQFDVEYYTRPDATHFVHVVTTQNLQNKGSYIDHAGLNNNPNAKLEFFQNLAPAIRGGIGNRYNIKIQYDTTVNKWYMSNTNGRQLDYADAYNIAISSGPDVIKTFGGKDSSLTVNGIKNISTNQPPAVGQVLKWNGSAWAPGNDSTCCPTNSNNNNTVAGWSMSGANLYSSNQGFVGIGWKNPAAPLGFSPSLGKKISLYPGTTGDAGFGVAPNRLQIFSDNPNADVAIGYDAAGAFNERFAVKANGALAVNGNTGNAGQILQSNGPNAPASWQNGTGGIQSFMHFVPRVFSTDTTLIFGDLFPNTIHVTQNSTLVISATFVGLGHTFVLDNEAQLVDIRINGVTQNINLVLVAAPRSEGSATISNYLYNALPGNYDIEFVSKRASAYNALSEISVKLSSVLVLPNNTAANNNTNTPAIK